MASRFTKQELKSFFDKLSEFTDKTNQSGSKRLAYSIEDEAAHQWLIDEMKQYGLAVRIDHVGNVYARLPGQQSHLPAIGTGSHIDTVPQGGHYDGVIGVLTGLYALLQYQPTQLKRDLELIIFRAEESSRFGFSCVGSKAITGKIDVDKWSKNVDSSGKSFFDVVQECGYSQKDNTLYSTIMNEQCELPDNYLDGFVEVHIEQGKVLEAQQKRIGIVHGIAAPTRFNVIVKGHADHSGATPMNQRSDALVASAEMIKDLQLAACKESGYSTVGTVGKLDVQPNSMNVIPGYVSFYVDIRGIDTESIERVVSALMESAKSTELTHQCQITIREISKELPVKLNDELCSVIENICHAHSIPTMLMMSGAGHDSMNMAYKFPTAMIFIPSKEGISHHPDEYSKWEDVELAADLLTETLGYLANK